MRRATHRRSESPETHSQFTVLYIELSALIIGQDPDQSPPAWRPRRMELTSIRVSEGNASARYVKCRAG